MPKSPWEDGEEIPLPQGWDGGVEVPLNPDGSYNGDALQTIPAEVQPEGNWIKAMFPRSVASVDRGEAWYSPKSLVAGVLDPASLPWRAGVAGVQQGAQAARNALGMDGDNYTFREDLARTGGESDGFLGAVEEGVRSPINTFIPAAGQLARAPAWLASQAPAWLRGAVAGVELGANAGSKGLRAVRSATAGVPAGITAATTLQGENYAAGRPVSVAEGVRDVGIGAGIGLGGSILGQGLASFGRGAQKSAKNLLQSIIKPQGVDEIQGFERALGAGLLPEFAGYGTLTAKGAGKRFLGRLDEQAAGYEPALAAADATGQMVNASQVMRNARGDVAGKISGGNLVVSPESAQRGIDWAGDIMAAPGSADEVMARMAGVTPERMARGPVVALSRQAEIAPSSTMRGPVVIREQVAAPPPTAFQDVIVGGVRRRIGEAVPQSAQLGATMAEMGGQSLPARTMEVGTGKYRELVGGVAPSSPDVMLLPSVANRRKSGMWKEAFKSQDADQTARGAGALATGRAANAELGKISPELADLNARLAPYYAGSDAALRAATTRGNQYFVGPMELWGGAIGAGTGSAAGLGGAASGTVMAVALARAARSPAFARLLYDAGRISEATYRALQTSGGQTLGRQLMGSATVSASPTDNARGGR